MYDEFVRDLGDGFIFIDKGSPLLDSCILVERILCQYRGVQFFTGEMILTKHDSDLIKTASEEELSAHGIDDYTDAMGGKYTIFWVRDAKITPVGCLVIREYIIGRIMQAEK